MREGGTDLEMKGVTKRGEERKGGEGGGEEKEDGLRGREGMKVKRVGANEEKNMG